MTTPTKAEREVLSLYLLVSTPKVDLTNNPLYRGLQRKGWLSVQPMRGDRTRARVVTTDAGDQALKEFDAARGGR